jgi:O-Antigen ligase
VNINQRIRPRLEVAKLTIADYLFFCMMAFVSIPNILEVWGIETIFKPYRVLAMIIGCFSISQLIRMDSLGRKLAYPILFAIFYTTCMLFLFGEWSSFVGEIPAIGTMVLLLVSPLSLSSRKAVLYCLYASVISYLISSYYGMLAFNQGEYRLRGLFENPNSFGYAGCFVLLFSVNRFFPIPKMFRFILVFLTLPVMILTGSRGAILAAMGGFFSQVLRNPKLAISTAFVIACFFVASTFFESAVSKYTSRSVFDRLTKRDMIERGGEGRVALTMAGFRVAAEHGFIGIGFGQYRERHHTRFFQHLGLDGRLNKLGLHSFYATIICEWGLVGVCCFGIVFIRLVRFSRGLHCERDWVLGFLGISLASGLGNHLISEVHFWVMLGICIQMVRLGRIEEHNRGARSLDYSLSKQ